MSNYLFEGLDTVMMANEYKTPLYLISENFIVQRIDEIKESFIYKYDNTWAAYASKAFLNKEMARIIKREGIGMDVVSGGELYTAKSVDFPMEDIMFHGNGKTKAELEMAIEYGVGRIIVDNIDELLLLNDLAKKYNKEVNILFRITPGVSIDTHKYIQTGQVDSKFGIPLKDGIIYDAIKKAISLESINLLGIHFHVGSQLHSVNSHLDSINIGINIINEIKNRFEFEIKELNVGGGFGVRYKDDADRKPLRFFMEPIMEKIESLCEIYQLKRPKIIIEPGRWVVAEAGITLYTVTSTKEIPNVRNYISIDGGMTDNPRTALYGAKYEAVVANKFGEKNNYVSTIAGKCCESGDILLWDLESPKIEVGDTIAVFATGAYNYSMASNYNRIPKAAVVMIKDSVPRIIVKRESYEDIINNDI